VYIHPEIKNWVKYARYEERFHFVQKGREVFERAVEFYGDDILKPELFAAFARYEERQKEYERARAIYKYAIDKIDRKDTEELLKSYTIFEKKFGNRSGIETAIVSRRKAQYEAEVKKDPYNYDAWFDYLRLSEEEGDSDATRLVYERAISFQPPVHEKRHWRRYIYLWVYYAVYEELVTKDMKRAKDIYHMCLEVIPHKKFTFAKIWIMYSKFAIRQKDVLLARKVLGSAIGKCPKIKLFRTYIEIELGFREFDRCRKLYDKFLEYSPSDCNTWCRYAELETMLGDTNRARALYEIAINEEKLDMPENVWKAYIDFEKSQEEYDNVRSLYHKLLDKTQHIKVWLSYATFEMSLASIEGFEGARKVFQRANSAMKHEDSKEERMLVIRSWKEFEEAHGTPESLLSVEKQEPKELKRRRKVVTDDGTDAGWEEYTDYVFPEDDEAQPTLKLLSIAKNWRKDAENADSSSSDSSDDSDNED